MIYVSPDFRIKPDKYCYILESRSDGKTKQTGDHKDIWTVSYHPSYTQIGMKILKDSLSKEIVEGSCKELTHIDNYLNDEYNSV